MSDPSNTNKTFPWGAVKELTFAIISPPVYALSKIYGWYKGSKPTPPPKDPPKE